MERKYVSCKKCKWISFAVTKEYAIDEVNRFNDWYETQTEEVKARYGDPSSLYNYTCQICDGKDFILATDKQLEAVYGCTISPVIYED